MTSRLSIRFVATLLILVVSFDTSYAQLASMRHVPLPSSQVWNASTPQAPPPAVTSGMVAIPKKFTSKQTPQQVLAVYSHGDPTDQEQLMLEMINRARANPDSEGIRLSTTTDPDVAGSYTYFNPYPTRAQVRAAFTTMPAQPPLAFNAKIINAARLHSQWMLDNKIQDHTGEGGSSPFQRMNAAGYTGWSGAGENIFCFGKSIWHSHAGFNIDFGEANQQTLGHRKNIMNYEGSVFTEIGIGIINGTNGNFGPIVTTQDFGTKNQHFITGVAYADENQNGFYDIGEGLAGVTITPSDGSTWTTVTSSSGGYALPMDNGAGTVTITASGGGLGGNITRQVNFGSENVKMDFTKDFSGFPAQVQVLFPISDTVLNVDTAVFTWSTITGSTKYHMQLATDEAMSELLVNDSTLTTTSRKLAGLQEGVTYFWRVRAKNAKGWGQYSAKASFSIALPPSKLVLVSPLKGASVSPDEDITFKWKNPPVEPTDYWFELATDLAMTKIVYSETLGFTFDTTHTIYDVLDTSIRPFTTYYWRIRAENEVGWSAPNEVWNFSTTASSVRSTDDAVLGSLVSPNPTRNEAHITFTLANSADVSLKVFNTLGMTEAVLVSGKLTPDKYDFIFNGTNKADGIYIYELRIGEKMEHGRIVLVK